MSIKIQNDYIPLIDFVFTFKDVQLNVIINESNIGIEDRDKIKRILDICSKEISIDKSYVQFNGTKYKKTFIREQGWNTLTYYLIATNMGKNVDVFQELFIMESYNLMICCYLYQVLEDYGFDTKDVLLEIKDKSKFIIEIQEDTYKEWDRYCGDWRQW